MAVMTAANLVIDIRQIRNDARSGRLSVEQLLDIIDKQQQTIRRLEGTACRLKERLAQYEPEVSREFSGGAAAAESGTPTLSYSVEAENKRRRRRRRRKKSPGRRLTELKFSDAEQFRDIYPDGVRRGACQLVRERAVWRLENGRAVRVGYRILDRKSTRLNSSH